MRLLLLFIWVLLLSYSSFSQLSGTYTIGGASPDYLTITNAVNDLNTNGVSGPVIFNIRTGIYNEQIIINEFLGSSSLNTVTFQSETNDSSDVIIEHLHATLNVSDNFTIYINGADNLIFKKLTLKAIQPNLTDNERCRVLYIVNDANNIIFQNNEILSFYSTITQQDTYAFAVYIGGGVGDSKDNDTILFHSNYIEGGNVGIGYRGAGLSLTSHFRITKNTFKNQGLNGILSEVALY